MEDAALARFMRDLATAATRLADSLEGSGRTRKSIDPIATLRGHRQLQLVRLPGMRTERGMTTGEIAKSMKYDQPNVYNTCHELMTKGVIEQVASASPMRFRLVSSARAS